MSKPKIIALCGSIGAGKDTVGKLLSEHHGYATASFAYRLKVWVLDLFRPLGMEERHVFGTQADKAEPLPQIIGPNGEPRTGRQILEILGTEGGRAVMPAIWTTLALREAQDLIERTTVNGVVFTDARFANEFAAAREAGGVVWEVVKVGGPAQTLTGHPSDTEWRELPKDGTIIARHGDIGALEVEVAALLALGGQRHMAVFGQS